MLLCTNTGSGRSLHVMFTYCLQVMIRSQDGAYELTFSSFLHSCTPDILGLQDVIAIKGNERSQLVGSPRRSSLKS